MKHSPQAVSVIPWLYWSLFPVHRVFLNLYFGQIVTKGLEYLPEFGPVVLAPKHFSRWDPLVLALLRGLENTEYRANFSVEVLKLGSEEAISPLPQLPQLS